MSDVLSFPLTQFFFDHIPPLAGLAGYLPIALNSGFWTVVAVFVANRIGLLRKRGLLGKPAN